MPILSNEPSTSTKTVANLEAELAAMEEEEAAEAHCKQEHKEKKKKLAELAEARKAEEAAAAAAVEVAQKAVKKAAKQRVETQGPDEANKKQELSMGWRSWHRRGVIGVWLVSDFFFF